MAEIKETAEAMFSVVKELTKTRDLGVPFIGFWLCVSEFFNVMAFSPDVPLKMKACCLICGAFISGSAGWALVTVSRPESPKPKASANGYNK